MKWFRKFAANDVPNNKSYFFRKRRFSLFVELLDKNKISKTILDIGGANYFWKQWESFLRKNLFVVLVNIEKSEIYGYNGILGDAKHLTFLRDKSVDVILSNSVIEHLPGIENQEIFAKEVQRIGQYYFIQTPAFLFPLEPHFLFPFFHWIPKKVRIFLNTKFNLGWFEKELDVKKAELNVTSIRILRKKELKRFFPNGKIITERFLCFPKSYVVTNM